MILRSGFKPFAFVTAIENTIARGQGNVNCIDSDADLTPEALDHGDGAIYLAGGYWRALPTWDDEGHLVGVRLVNPDRTPDEIAVVERAIAILCRFDWAAEGDLEK